MQPASGPSNAASSWTRRTPSGRGGTTSGGATTITSVATVGHGFDGVVEQRPAVDRLGELVAAEPRRATAGEDDPAHGRQRGRGHVPPRAPAGARGPGTWPAGVRRRIAAPVEVLEDRHDVLAARAGRVAERRRGERRVPASASACAARSRYVGHRVGQVRLEDDDPAAALELADRRPAGSRQRAAASRSGGGAGTARAATSRSIAAATAGSAAAGLRASGARTRSPSRTRRPSGHQRRPRGRQHVPPRRPRSRSPGVEAPGPLQTGRPPAVGPGIPGRAAWCARTASSGRGDAASRTSGATSRSLATMPWSSSRAAAAAATSPACAAAARAATRSGVCRRRETPRAGSGSRTTPPTPAGPDVAARRSTNRSPVAAAIGLEAERSAAAAPSGRSSASRPVRPTIASDRGRSEVDADARPVRDGGARARRAVDPMACTSGSSVRTTPRCRPPAVDRRPG